MAASPSQILVYAVTEIEIDQYTLIEQSVYCVIFNKKVNSKELYSYVM